MTEAFLHHLFDSRKLGKSFQTTTGESLEVLSFGTLNKSSGPDFLEASIRFDDKIWAGHIEFHLKSSDWLKHGHQNDQAYSNVVAHFVYEHDQEILSGEYLLPVIELKDLIISRAFDPNNNGKKQKEWIPCESSLGKIDEKIIQEQLSKALKQRLTRKRNEVVELLKANTNDQKRVMLILLARTLGGRYNANAMETLVSKIRFETMPYVGGSFYSIRTFLFGLAGLENNSHFNYLQNMFQLQPMTKIEWKTSGMRPASQPNNRLAQFAAVLHNYEQIDFYANQDQWRAFFSMNKYESVPALSNSYKDLLLINAVVPFLLAIAWLKEDCTLEKKAMYLLDCLSAEKNSIVKRWTQIGVKPVNARETQALIEQNNAYCNEKKCLICSIGKKVLEQ